VYRNPFENYQTIERKTASGRELEACILSKAAQRLRDCQRNWDAPDREPKLTAALKNNQRIWTVLQVELSRDDNPLPETIKHNLILLSGFVDKRVFEVLAYPSVEKLNILIDINNNIAAGLRQSPQDAQRPSPPASRSYPTPLSHPLTMAG
jgi:flagellar protein FlaF